MGRKGTPSLPADGGILFVLFVLVLSVLSARWRRFAEQLYREYHHILRRRCRRILRDETLVDDAMQEVFWTICRQAEQYKGEPDKILPWLYRVTTTHCLKQIEKDKRWVRNVGIAIEEGAVRYEDNLSRGELEAQVAAQEFLMRLPPTQRQAILYRYVSGMTQREIAEVMEVTRDQVRTWLDGFAKRGEIWRAEQDQV